MKNIFFIILNILSLRLVGQSDTIVVADFTKIMTEVGSDGQLRAATDLKDAKVVGFFIEESVDGYLRVCNNQRTNLWVDGRMLDAFSGCRVFDLDKLGDLSARDTLYVSIYSSSGLMGLRCENIRIASTTVVDGYKIDDRPERDLFNEFLIIATLTILGCFGWIINMNQARRNYLLRKTLSLKLSSYEFVNTTFLSQSNLLFLILISLIAGLLFSIDSFVKLDDMQVMKLSDFILLWLATSLISFFLLFIKWVITSLVSALFRFKKMNDFQLFDFENFLLISCSLVCLFFIFGYFFFEPLQFLIQKNVSLIITLILGLFLAWFGFKFVNNSSRKKLQIISYLCATEIIPLVLFYMVISK